MKRILVWSVIGLGACQSPGSSSGIGQETVDVVDEAAGDTAETADHESQEGDTTCQDECIAGELVCVGNGVGQCGQADADACREFLPALACADGTTCSVWRMSCNCDQSRAAGPRLIVVRSRRLLSGPRC